MTERDDSPPLPTHAPAESSTGTETTAAEDLACLQAALEERQHERARLLTKSHTAGTDVHVKLQHAELRVQQVTTQLDATQRSAQAMRARLDADLQATRARAEAAQAALAASEATNEDLRIANAELSTAIDAAQWRLGELEAETTVQRDALHQLEEARHADLDRLAELEQAVANQQQAAAAAAARQAEVTAALHAARTHAAALRSTLDQLQVERNQLLAARDDADRRLTDQSRARDGLLERLTALEAERAAWGEREAALHCALEDLRTQHGTARRVVEQELAALQARLVAQEEERQRLDARLAAAHAERERVDAQHRNDRDTLTATIRSLEEALQQRGEELAGLEQQVAAAQAERVEAEAVHHAARTVLEQEAQRLRVAQAEALQSGAEKAAQHEGVRNALTAQVATLQDELRQRDTRIEQLQKDLAHLETQQAQSLQRAVEAGRRREEEWHATCRTQQEELDVVRRTLLESDAARFAAQQRSEALAQQLEKQAIDLEHFRTQAEAAAALAQQSAVARSEAEQGVADLQQRAATLAQERQALQKESEVIQRRHDAMAAKIAELDNERSALSLRIDELTALTGQLERECERLRRDRGSTEEIRRVRADNARLEAKILELDRQRTEAVQRHSAAVAGYMVELNQRSEALRARDVELQRFTEELALVKQGFEDSVNDLAVQRQQQASLERQLAELRTASRPVNGSPATESIGTAAAAPARLDSAPSSPVRPPVSKPAKRPANDDASAAPTTVIHLPFTVIHLEDAPSLCEAVRDVVARVPESRYQNALDPVALNATDNYVLAINLLSRTHDPLEALASFIACDTYHKEVFAYCADGTTGFSFGTAAFFSQPVDPDACVAQLLESRGAIHRLLVATENFGIVGGLRTVLSRMRSSVSAALDLRQVTDLLQMVAPDVVLVDLSLPRGEGLRVVGRLRADPKTGELPLGILLPAQGSAAEFRQHALRAAREMPMSIADLGTALGRHLGTQHASGTRERPVATAQA